MSLLSLTSVCSLVTAFVTRFFLCLGYVWHVLGPWAAVILELHFLMVVHCNVGLVFVGGGVILVGTLYLQCVVYVILS
jgi:hypothetical protein